MDINFSKFGNFGMYDSLETLSYIRSRFATDNPNPKASIYTKKIHAILPNGRFDIGLYHNILEEVKSRYPDATIVETHDFKEAIYPHFLSKEPVNIDNIKYYDYQYESIKEMLSNGRGVVKIPTGGGKGVIMGGFMQTVLKENPKLRILCIVPNSSLLSQLYKEFKNVCKIDSITKWSGSHDPDLTASLMVCNLQILNINTDRAIKTIRDYDIIIIDECHKIKKNNKINSVLNMCITSNIFGLTGTIPKDPIDMWNMIGKIGKILYTKTSSEIRSQAKSIAPVEVKALTLTHKKRPKKYVCKPPDPFIPNQQYINEIEFLYDSEWRNQFICNISEKLNGNVLILVDRINHGETLCELLKKTTNKQVEWINGDLPVPDRDAIQARMEIQDDIACVAIASIFSTGISIKNLKYIIFVCIGKSFTLVVQSIGRSLRLHENKTKSVIFDINDTTKYSELHFLERLKFYEEEEINYEIRKIKESK